MQVPGHEQSVLRVSHNRKLRKLHPTMEPGPMHVKLEVGPDRCIADRSPRISAITAVRSGDSARQHELLPLHHCEFD
eukprot:765270-Hanusia_phi.AAC.8